MENLESAIKSVMDKEAVDFKQSIINELSVRLYNALNEARLGVAKSMTDSTDDSTIEFFEDGEPTEESVDEGFAQPNEKELRGMVKFFQTILSDPKKLQASGFDKKEAEENLADALDMLKSMEAFAKEYAAAKAKAKGKMESAEVVGEDIQEKVDLDGRTSLYRATVARIEQARKIREQRAKNNAKEVSEDNEKFSGLYDDGTGRGARIPKALDINSGRFPYLRKEAVEITEDDYTEATQMQNGKYTMKEEELSPAQKKYRQFFNNALKKFGAKSPADLDDTKKKEFFNYIKTNYKP